MHILTAILIPLAGLLLALSTLLGTAGVRQAMAVTSAVLFGVALVLQLVAA